MESERGIIIIGNCRSGKIAMMHRALKHCSDIHFKESIEEVKKLNHHFEIAVTAGYNFREELLKLVELEKTIQKGKLIEKPQSKFISRPRNNFRKR